LNWPDSVIDFSAMQVFTYIFTLLLAIIALT